MRRLVVVFLAFLSPLLVYADVGVPVKCQPFASAPVSCTDGTQGRCYTDTDDAKVYFCVAGSWSSTYAGSPPGGSDTQLQYNNGGSAFGGASQWTYNNSTGALTSAADTDFNVGTTSGGLFSFLTVGNPDYLFIGTGAASNSIHVGERADSGYNFTNGPCGTSPCDDPALIIHSRTQGTGQWLALRHVTTHAYISTGTGRLALTNRTTISDSLDPTATEPVLHVLASTVSGATYNSADALTVEKNGAVAFNLIGAAGQTSGMVFSLGTTRANGSIYYDAGDSTLNLFNNAAVRLTVTSTGIIKAGTQVSSLGSAPAVSNTTSNSCGTSAASITGTDTTGVVTVGATFGTSCTLTFNLAAVTRRQCQCSDETTTSSVCNAHYTDTTHNELIGTFTAGDKINYSCLTY